MIKNLTATLLAATVLLQAAKSPHETISGTIGGSEIKISYGRPYLKGRTIGKDIVPYGEAWRLGADEATKLTTPVDIMIGNLAVPAGSYALYTMPSASGWKLIVNKDADQWGTEYESHKANNLGMVDLHIAKASAPVEQLTMMLEPGSGKTGKLKFAWGTTAADVDLKVK